MPNKIEIIIEAIDKVSGTFSNIDKNLKSLGKSLAVGGAAMTGAFTVPIVGGLMDSVKGALDAESKMAELEAVIKSTGGAAGLTASEITKMAGELQKITKFEDDSVIQGQSMLLTFTKIGKDVFPEATMAMLNMTEKFGNMEQASIQLGKALNDPVQGVGALRRVGVMLSDEQEAQIKNFVAVGDIASAQKVILSELETEFGGLAVAAGQTTAGQIEIARNSFAALKDEIGVQLLPVITEFFTELNAFVSDPAVREDLVAIAKDMASALMQLAKDGLPVIKELLDKFKNLPQPVKDAAGGFLLLLAAVGPVLMILGGLVTGIGAVVGAIGLLPAALIAAVGALVGVIATMGQQAMSTVWLIYATIGAVFALIANRIMTAIQNALNWIASKVGEAKTIGVNLVNALRDGVLSAAQGLINAVKITVSNAINEAKKLLKIKSPSAVFEDIGKNVMLGMAGGIESANKLPQTAMNFSGLTNTAAGISAPVSGPGGGATVIVNYSPVVSLADEAEARTKLLPYIREALRAAQ